MEAMKILVVEDDFIIAEDIAQILQNAGYTITNILARGEEVLNAIETQEPDLILLDITLAGKKSGIEVGEEIHKNYQKIPFIYLTSYTDQSTVEKAKYTFPAAYMTKPFDERDLEIAIDLAIFNFAQNKSQLESKEQEPLIMKDCIFVKKDNRFEKLELSQVLLVEASGHYLIFYTKDQKQFVIGGSLKSFLEKVQQGSFVQVHRSFIVNIENISGFDEDFVYIDKRSVPIGKTYRKDFVEKFRFF
jgi:DNA-binding LytR/AlgR family response regulator